MPKLPTQEEFYANRIKSPWDDVAEAAPSTLIPDGYEPLLEFVDRAGRDLFPGTWTGEEAETGQLDGMSTTSKGWLGSVFECQVFREWNEAKSILSKEQQAAEFTAKFAKVEEIRGRRDRVIKNGIRAALWNGNVRSAYVDGDGTLQVLPKEIWGSDPAWIGLFANPRREVRIETDRGELYQLRPILVEIASAERWLESELSGADFDVMGQWYLKNYLPKCPPGPIKKDPAAIAIAGRFNVTRDNGRDVYDAYTPDDRTMARGRQVKSRGRKSPLTK